jgi:hypothetical protein
MINDKKKFLCYMNPLMSLLKAIWEDGVGEPKRDSSNDHLEHGESRQGMVPGVGDREAVFLVILDSELWMFDCQLFLSLCFIKLKIFYQPVINDVHSFQRENTVVQHMVFQTVS